MLNVNNLIGFGAGAGAQKLPLVATYISTYSSTADTASYTVTNANLGTPYSGRVIVIGIIGQFGTTNYQYTNLTVGGVAATRIANVAAGAALQSSSAFFAIQDSTNTTANIVATANAAFAGMALAIWDVSGLDSVTPLAANAVSTSSNTTSLNIPITISSPGVCLAVGKCVNTAGITGFTINASYAFETTNSFVAGNLIVTTPPGATNVTITSSTASAISGAAVFFSQG